MICETPFYDGKLKDTLTWWLCKRQPFIVNDEYEIRLLFIDKVNNSAKIEITNIKTKTASIIEVKND